MPKYLLIGATKDHVEKGKELGIAQAGHGRKDLVSRLSKGDYIIYYSAKDAFENGKPYQKFTAIGEVTDEVPYQPETKSNFKPYRRNVTYETSKDADIKPLLNKLSFIKDAKHWGFYLMSGFREILKEDFDIIAKAMK